MDDKGSLVRTGIVYNEMKGNYSSQEGIASEWSIRSLFPDNTYNVDSGGDPDFIPSLSYEDLLNFTAAGIILPTAGSSFTEIYLLKKL